MVYMYVQGFGGFYVFSVKTNNRIMLSYRTTSDTVIKANSPGDQKCMNIIQSM